MADDKIRRPRGASPRGVFETSKAAAFETIEAEQQAERIKRERLRTLREQRDQKPNSGIDKCQA